MAPLKRVEFLSSLLSPWEDQGGQQEKGFLLNILLIKKKKGALEKRILLPNKKNRDPLTQLQPINNLSLKTIWNFLQMDWIWDRIRKNVKLQGANQRFCKILISNISDKKKIGETLTQQGLVVRRLII